MSTDGPIKIDKDLAQYHQVPETPEPEETIMVDVEPGPSLPGNVTVTYESATGPLFPSSIPTVHQAIGYVVRDLRGVGKDQQNTDQRYRYRGIEDVLKALHPVLGQHGVFIVPHVIERLYEDVTSTKGTKGRLVNLHMSYEIFGPRGDRVLADTWGEALDYSDKGTNKAMTAAFKYMLCEVFAIGDGEEEADSVSPEVVAEPSAVAPQSPKSGFTKPRPGRSSTGYVQPVALPPKAQRNSPEMNSKAAHPAGSALASAPNAKGKAAAPYSLDAPVVPINKADGGERKASTRALNQLRSVLAKTHNITDPEEMDLMVAAALHKDNDEVSGMDDLTEDQAVRALTYLVELGEEDG